MIRSEYTQTTSKMLVRLQNFRFALVRTVLIKLLTNKMSGWSRGGSTYNRNADRLRDRLAASRNETPEAGPSQSHRGGKHPPGLKGREIGQWYRNNQTSRNKESEPVVRLVSSITFATSVTTAILYFNNSSKDQMFHFPTTGSERFARLSA